MSMSYPLSFVLQLVGTLFTVPLFYFVDRFLVSGAAATEDYFTYVVLGLVAVNILQAGLQTLGQEVDYAVQQGRFEMLLTEPISWKFLPIGLAAWPLAWRSFTSILVLMVGQLLGARFDWSGLLMAIPLAFLGMLAGVALGTLSCAVRVLSKRSDPILVGYSLLALIVGGVYFPPSLLPQWLQPFAWLVPHTYLAAGLRHALMIHPPAGEVSAGAALLGLAMFAAIGIPVSLWIFQRSLDVGRRVGALASY
jgi:ABC-2 type transport system permease protein